MAVSGQIELARLVDLAAERLKLSVAYDAATLKGTVTLRLASSIGDDETWSLTNQVLAVQGFASVRSPDGLIRIIKLADAGSGARVTAGPLDLASRGFVAVVVRVQHQPIKMVIESIKPVLSKPGGSVVDFGACGLILISDVRAKVDDALEVLRMVGVESEECGLRLERCPATDAQLFFGKMTTVNVASMQHCCLPCRSQPRIDGLALHRQNTEDTFMHTA